MNLTYNGAVVRDSGERLNLTDMWRAAGEPEHKRPAEWARRDGAEFITFLADAENMAVGHILSAERGRTGSTWAHWQIGLAYAKYLSPEFHMWCNTVVRERMIGKPSAEGMTPAVFGGIAKGVINKAIDEAIRVRLPELVAAAIAADPRIAVGEFVSVRELLDDAKVPTRGRNRLNRRIGHALRSLALHERVGARRCPRTNTWLFPVDFARRWMAKHGCALVSEHTAAVLGQGVLPFQKPRRVSAVPVEEVTA